MAYTTIDDPTKFFSTNLWVADNASSRSLTGFGHQPDLVWTKHRGSGATNPAFTDSVRGGDKQLNTPTTAVEDAGSHGKISSFDSDGITVIDGTNATYPRLYFNSLNPFGASVGGNYVGWSWKAGTSFSNDASATGVGDIDSSGSINTDSGLSIISYNGNNTSSAEIAHGLGTTPSMIIQKRRADSIASWRVWHNRIHATSGETNTLLLNTSAANASDSDNISGVSSTTFTVRGAGGATNPNGSACIAYCFAEKKGYSKFGSYKGNGNTNGTFVYTGFRPAFMLVKKSSGTKNWYLWDSKRASSNDGSDPQLYANLANAEDSAAYFDILSNGFKNRNTGVGNDSGGTYMYMAFAEHPFVTAGTKAAGTAR